jgi:hypothetical protein
VLGHAHARARHHERRHRRNIESQQTVAARPAGIEHRTAGVLHRYAVRRGPHSARETGQFLNGLALHTERGQQCGGEHGSRLAGQHRAHRGFGLLFGE